MFRNVLRRYLGTDTLPRLENTMGDILTLLNGLVTQTTEATAAQQASFLNLHNGLNRQEQAIRDLTARLDEAVANNGQVTPEMQELANRIQAGLTDIKTAADTADNGFEPVEVPTEDPTVPVEQPETPVEETPGEGDTGTTSRRR